MQTDRPSPIPAGTSDHVAAVLRAVAGAVPVAGPALAELITYVIPSARTQRLEDYLRQLAERLDTLDAKVLKQSLASPQSIYLLEEGARQAVRAISPERIGRLADVVAHGIGRAELPFIETRRILRLLDDYDDAELIMLASYLEKNRYDEEFLNRHADILAVEPAHAGSGIEAVDAEAVAELGRRRLEQLDLLDTSGASTRVSPLGRLLLRHVGLADKDDL